MNRLLLVSMARQPVEGELGVGVKPHRRAGGPRIFLRLRDVSGRLSTEPAYVPAMRRILLVALSACAPTNSTPAPDPARIEVEPERPAPIETTRETPPDPACRVSTDDWSRSAQRLELTLSGGAAWGALRGREGGRGAIFLPPGNATSELRYTFADASVALEGTATSDSVKLRLAEPTWFAGVIAPKNRTAVQWKRTEGGRVEVALRLTTADAPSEVTARVDCGGVSLAPAAYDVWTIAAEGTKGTGTLTAGSPLTVRQDPGGTVAMELGIARPVEVALGPERAGERLIAWDMGDAVLRGWVPADRVSSQSPPGGVGYGTGRGHFRPRLPPRSFVCDARVRAYVELAGRREAVGWFEAETPLRGEDDIPADGFHPVQLPSSPVDLQPGAQWVVEVTELQDCRAEESKQ